MSVHRSATPIERLATLGALQELVARPDNAWENAWAGESEDRVDAYQRGELQAEEFDEVMAWMRQDFLGKA